MRPDAAGFARWRSVLASTVLLLVPARALAAVTLFAAASLGDVMADLGERWQQTGGTPWRLSLAASSTLARQIDYGAPADLFLSANIAWMDHLQDRDLIRADTRRVLARNRLVLIAPADSPFPDDVEPASLIARLQSRDRIAMGDPEHVPAGVYARVALEHLGLYAGVADRLVRTADVRATLALVARGEAPLGFVYATDARRSDQVRVLHEFGLDAHPPIIYPAALVTGGSNAEQAAQVMQFLASAEARTIWRAHGFADPSGN